MDELFSILPFEVDWFKARDYRVHYVGNPCVDAVEAWRKTQSPAAEGEHKKQIAILAGSRRQEIKDNLRMMLEAAATFKDYRLVIAGAPNIETEYYQRWMPQGVQAELRFGQTYQIISESAAALVTSGTATLETAIIGTPQVVCYYTPAGKLLSWLKSKILKVKYVSLVNLIVDKEIVQELVADRMTHRNIVSCLAAILPSGSGRQQMLSDYDEMNQALGHECASEKAAHEMVRLLTHRNDNQQQEQS